MSVTPKYRPVSQPVSGKRFQTQTDDFELENTRMLPETDWEMKLEMSETSPEMEAVKVLREIGKRIKEGESLVEIRKSLGVNSGRAVQEVNAALQLLTDIKESS